MKRTWDLVNSMIRIFLLLIVLLSSCILNHNIKMGGNNKVKNVIESSAGKLLTINMDEISDKLMTLLTWVEGEVSTTPNVEMYGAFCDINIDGIPEFFYGYKTATSYHVKIWYRIYSLTESRILYITHLGDWNLYLEDDSECAIVTGPDELFGKKLYKNSDGNIYFHIAIPVGAASYDGIESTKLWENNGNWMEETFYCEKNEYLPPDDKYEYIVETFGQLRRDNLEECIYNLLEEYEKTMLETQLIG